MSRIAIATDAWHPQINGVVTTLTQTAGQLERAGHAVKIINPRMFRSIPCPTYPEIRLSLTRYGQVYRELTDFSQPYGYLRCGDAGGDGLWGAGCRLSRERPGYYYQKWHQWLDGCRSWCRSQESSRDLAGIMPEFGHELLVGIMFEAVL